MSFAGLTDGDRKLFSTLSKERESQRDAEIKKESDKRKGRASRSKSNAAFRIKKNGAAKDAIRRLAGTTLKYPRDIFTETTDYLSFDFHEFGPYLQNPSGNGIQGSKLGTVFTYMPTSVRTAYGASWGASTIHPSGRVLMNAVNQAAQGASRDSISKNLNDNLLNPGTVAAGFFARAMAGQGSNISANSLIGMSQGVGINNTIELYWSGHGGQRTMTFNIPMVPKNEREADEVQNIIKSFKIAMHPSKNSSGGVQDMGGRFVEYPLAIQMRYMNKSRENQYLNKFKPMVITSVAVDYTPDNQYVTHEDGRPVACTMQLQMKEIKLLYADDIIESGKYNQAGF